MEMKRMGMVLAMVVLAGSILSGCVIRPGDGRFGDRDNYYGDRDGSPGHPGPYYHRDR